MSICKQSTQGLGFAVDFPDDVVVRGVSAFRVGTTPPAKMSRTAVGSGFAAAFLCFGLLSQQFSAVMAGDDSGALQFLLQSARSKPSVVVALPQMLPQAARGRPLVAGPTPNFGNAVFGSAWRTPEVRHRRPAAANLVPLSYASALPLTGSRWRGAVSDTPSLGSGNLARRSVCVRLCDGFFFPVGDLPNDGDIPGHEALCSGLCPGAPSRLYVVPAGSDRIEDAVATQTHKLYTALPVAFRHASKSDRTCSCQAGVQASSISLLKDFTLRRGDGVMTPKGIQIFRGAQHWPYKRNDFMSLAQTHDVTDFSRSALAAIEHVTKGNQPVLRAKASAAVPATQNSAPVAANLRDPNGKSVRLVGPQALQAE